MWRNEKFRKQQPPDLGRRLFFLRFFLPDAGRTGVFGENLKLIAVPCVVCRTWIAMRLDEEDLARHRAGVLVQVAFVDRAGSPYLNAGERELFVSGACNDCWSLLCPNPLEYN